LRNALFSPVAILAVFAMGLAICLSCGDDSTDSPPCFTLTAVGNGNGSIGIEPSSSCYRSGTNVTLTATPDNGWQFDNWTGDVNSTNNPVVVTIGESNMAVTANFSEITYTLSTAVSPANGGTVQVAPVQGSYSHGDTVTLTALPANDYTFHHWSGLPAGHDSLSNPLEVVMEDNYSITANFNYNPNPTTATIRGTVTWPGHSLSNFTYAFADTIYDGYLYLYVQTTVNQSTGNYTLTIEDMTGSVEVVVEAQDDVNNSGEWWPDYGDGWGFYDSNDDGQWNDDDRIVVSPGDNITGIDVELSEVIE